jgi:restriction endonuclease S subunit
VIGGGYKPKAYHDTPSADAKDDRWVVSISLKGTVGHVALHRADEIFAADGCTLWWSTDQEQIMTEFLFIALQRANLFQHKRGSGAPTLTVGEIVEKAQIEFPSLDEQREQVEQLEDIDKLMIETELVLKGHEAELRKLLRWSETKASPKEIATRSSAYNPNPVFRV